MQHDAHVLAYRRHKRFPENALEAMVSDAEARGKRLRPSASYRKWSKRMMRKM